MNRTATKPTPDHERPVPPLVAGRHDVEQREAQFWDQAIRSRDEDDLHVDTAEFDAAQRRRLELLRPLAGKRVLDIGCGTGFWSTLMAQHGAEVWPVDISPVSVKAAKERAEANGVGGRVHPRVMSAHDLDVEDDFFDLAHGCNIVHHLDASDFGREVARVLHSDGRAVFSENSANNKLLMFCRDYLCGRLGVPRWSTPDEYPLTRENRRAFARPFEEVEIEHPRFYESSFAE